MPPITIILLIAVIALMPLVIPIFITNLVSAAIFVFLYRTNRNNLLFALPVLPYLSALITLQNPINALEAIAFYPLALAVIFMLDKKSTRVQTVIAASCAFILFYAVFTPITVAAEYNGLNLAIMEQFLNDQIEPFKEFISLYTVTIGEETIPLYSEAQITDLINQTLLIIPAVLICFVNVFTYIVTALYRKLTQLFRQTSKIPDERWELKLSVVSAYVFCVTYVISIFGGTTIYGIVTVATQNIILILTPGFAYECVLALIRRFKNRENVRWAVIVCTVAFVMLFVSPGMVLTLLAFFGVAEAIITHHKIYK
ncbi:MAG: YybS family protein [Oscillospiraceae bacterium]|nr:YybS family protein [Oscillospiraceae bacterium]